MTQPDWRALRRMFPLLDRCVYLDTANFGPVSHAVADAAATYYAAGLTTPGEAASEAWYAAADGTRARVAALLNATPEEIGFVPNTSAAMSCAALLFEGSGAVLVGPGEHPTVVTPWYARHYRVDVAEREPDGRLTIEAYARALRPDTRVIAVSHVRYDDGRVNDLNALGALCRAHGLHLVVDAVQSAPMLPVDVAWGLDVVGFAGFKWFNAGHGIAALYVRDGLIERYGLPLAGRRSRRTNALQEITGLDPLFQARAFELGGLCIPSVLAFDAALQLAQSVGLAAVRARVQELATELRSGLSVLGLTTAQDGEEQVAGIVAINHPSPAETEFQLSRQGIHVAERRGRLRISPSWYNDSDDLQRCLDALAHCTSR